MVVWSVDFGCAIVRCLLLFVQLLRSELGDRMLVRIHNLFTSRDNVPSGKFRFRTRFTRWFMLETKVGKLVRLENLQSILCLVECGKKGSLTHGNLWFVDMLSWQLFYQLFFDGKQS